MPVKSAIFLLSMLSTSKSTAHSKHWILLAIKRLSLYRDVDMTHPYVNIIHHPPKKNIKKNKKNKNKNK